MHVLEPTVMQSVTPLYSLLLHAGCSQACSPGGCTGVP
jgi:hypothetical protein